MRIARYKFKIARKNSELQTQICEKKKSELRDLMLDLPRKKDLRGRKSELQNINLALQEKVKIAKKKNVNCKI